MKIMEKATHVTGTKIASLARSFGVRSLNRVCFGLYHQPKVPEGMNKFKKQ